MMVKDGTLIFYENLFNPLIEISLGLSSYSWGEQQGGGHGGDGHQAVKADEEVEHDFNRQHRAEKDGGQIDVFE